MAELDGGPKIVVLSKPGFQKKYITFSTHYGGMDSVFIRPGETEPTRVPDGIAHFLEHKLFDQPDGKNVLEIYSKMGASPNAYTGPYYTVYNCSLVDEFEKGFDLLLDYVQTPYFTDESVEKEQGIIEQEIQMGLDDPNRMVYYQMMESLYVHHPARVRTIGSVESIRQITKDLLYMCHDTFYHPSNMIVTVAGDVDVNRVIELVQQDMASRSYEPRGDIIRPIPDEPLEVAQDEVRHAMKVSRPRLYLAFKGNLDQREGESKRDHYKRLLAAELALGAVLGRSTKMYWDLYSKGVIAARYFYHLSVYDGAAHFSVSAESEDPEAFRDAVTDTLVHARDQGIDADLFEEARRREIGQIVSVLDDPQLLVDIYVTEYFRGLDLLERRALLDEIDVADGQAFLRDFVREGQRVLSVIEPIAAEGGNGQ